MLLLIKLDKGLVIVLSSAYYKQLMDVVLAHSKSSTWQEAKNEWYVSGQLLDKSDYDTCVCGYHPIIDLYEITNDETGDVLFPIGSVCIKKFESSRMNQGIQVASQMAGLMLHDKKYFASLDHLNRAAGFSHKVIDRLYRQHVFPPTKYNHYDPSEERDFMIKMFDRRSDLTFGQKYRLHRDLVDYVYPFLHKQRQEQLSKR